MATNPSLPRRKAASPGPRKSTSGPGSAMLIVAACSRDVPGLMITRAGYLIGRLSPSSVIAGGRIQTAGSRPAPAG